MRYFQFSLRDVWAGKVSFVTAANCVIHLPRGGAVGEWVGGKMAVSAEVEAIWGVEYMVAVTGADKPKKVKPRKYPEGVREQERKMEYAVTQAEQFRRKHGRPDG